jgi:hypothetical protein
MRKAAFSVLMRAVVSIAFETCNLKSVTSAAEGVVPALGERQSLERTYS